MLLYNTLSGRKEELKPMIAKTVKMYVCGPTVYEYDHLGHARTYLTFDLLNRFCRHFLGYKVIYVQNITDVGHLVGDGETGVDKLFKKARSSDQTAVEVANFFTKAHLKDLQSLNIILPDQFPKASDHLKEIISFVEELIASGFAYATKEGNVYFSVGKKADYGKLSHRGLAEIITGSRIQPASDKRSAVDFALWKAAPTGASEQVWSSPWGLGFPGWHIECSAMSRKYLGDTFDIHGSAIEHVFPHHENEIAQSEALTGKPLANFWVHAGMLSFGGQKMSRSTPSSMITIQDALKQYSANELRLAFFQTHYRRPFEYTRASMEQGVVLRRKFFEAYATTDSKKQIDSAEIIRQVTSMLADDLDSPKALSIVAANAEVLTQTDWQELFVLLGLKHMLIENQPVAWRLASERLTARAKGDFLTADNRKDELSQQGYEVVDRVDRTIYLPR